MKKFTGTVIRKKMPKTAIVLVKRLMSHPVYKKRMKRSKKYLVHDEIGVKTGDLVVIQQTRPLSKRKRFKIVEVL